MLKLVQFVLRDIENYQPVIKNLSSLVLGCQHFILHFVLWTEKYAAKYITFMPLVTDTYMIVCVFNYWKLNYNFVLLSCPVIQDSNNSRKHFFICTSLIILVDLEPEDIYENFPSTDIQNVSALLKVFFH